MKFIIAIAFFAVIATADILPELQEIYVDFKNERSVSSAIKNAIEHTSLEIRNSGLDPLKIERLDLSYKLPVPILFNYDVLIEDFLSTGMSDIVVNNISFLGSRLNFDIEMPLITFSVDEAAKVEATVFNDTFKMQGSGKVGFQSMRVVGNVRVGFKIQSGVYVRSAKVLFTLGGVESDVKFFVQDVDTSETMNKFLNTTVPATFKDYSAEINELFEKLLVKYITKYMKQTKVNEVN